MVSQTRYRRYCIDVTIVLVKSYNRVIHIIKEEKRGKETKMVKRWNRPSLPLLYHCGRKSSPWNAWEEGRGRERENSWSSMRSRVSKERIFYSSNSRQRIRSSILIPSSLKRNPLFRWISSYEWKFYSRNLRSEMDGVGSTVGTKIGRLTRWRERDKGKLGLGRRAYSL